jgi:hypothetical protein
MLIVLAYCETLRALSPLLEGWQLCTQAQCTQVTSPLLTALSSAPLVFSSTLLGPVQAFAGLLDDCVRVSVGLGCTENG